MRLTSPILGATPSLLFLFSSSLLLLPSLVVSQGGSVLDTIPQCYQDCIKQSGDFTCNGLDIKCLCRLSNGNFLTNVITCIRANCDNNLNTTSLVQPVADTCAAYGVPIAPAVVANAKSIAGALAATPTLTGATTMTSTIASAGTMYVVAVPLSAVSSSGRSGSVSVRTSTGSISTVTRMSISGGSAVSTTTSSSTTSSSTTESMTTTATATQAVNAASSTDEAGRATQGGNGSPFSSGAGASFAATERGSRRKWLVGVLCTSGVLILGLLLS